MSNATVANETSSGGVLSAPTIRSEEAAHFGGLAKDWWDPAGSSAMLHKLNPVRLGFIRGAIDAHWGEPSEAALPLADRSALDIGCGAGLLCEPLARLGARVTGVDAAPENIAAARTHAQGSGLLDHSARASQQQKDGTIRYYAGEFSALGLDTFDLITSMEVIEHVADKKSFIAQISERLAASGMLIMSTPNRTLASRALLVEGAERLGMIPRGTHDWHDFITPDELREMLANNGLTVRTVAGIAFSPMRGLHLSEGEMSLNYILSAVRD